MPSQAGPFCHDSRRCREGEVFLAIRTDRADGHRFLVDAQHHGAMAALVERQQEIDLPQFLVPLVLEASRELACAQRLQWGNEGRRPLIAISGSYGKTSMKDTLALLLGERALATFENRNNILGISLTLSHLEEKSHDRAVVEIGIDRPGEMAIALEMAKPDLGIITGITPVHVVNFGSLEYLAEEKARLLYAVRASGGRIYFPSSCLCYSPFKALADVATIITPLGERKHDDIARTPIYYDFKRASSRLTLFYGEGVEESYHLPPLSYGQVANVVLAIGVAKDMGCTREYLQERLGQWQPSTGRGQWRPWRNGRVYLDCYNANPVAMRDAVEFFHHETPHGRRIWILGAMRELGSYSKEAHRQLSEQLPLRFGDTVIGIGSEMAMGVEAIRRRSVSGVELLHAETVKEAKGWVTSLEGIFFVKGSRCYALEQLFEET
jgi:UDP-N-acetylmuramoyl-tripeptide--D-alanyl-D-alanine ligase